MMKNFHVYRSSAGSGKTYTLVKEYLKLALSNDPNAYRHILAITFTNKAANEMRERILRNLTEIADPQAYHDSNAVKVMLPQLQEECGLDQKAIILAAGKVLSNIMHNYQDFAVSTIDSFIHRIVRTFAFDLHIPLNFEVELQDDTLVGQAVDLLLIRVGLDSGTTKALKDFTYTRILDEKNWNIEGDLRKFSMHLLKDDILAHMPALQQMDAAEILEAGRTLNSLCRNFEKDVSGMAGSLVSFWDQHGIASTDLSYGSSGVYGYVTKLKNRNYKDIGQNSRARAALGEDKWYPNKVPGERKVLIDTLKPGMNDLLRSLLSYIDGQSEQYGLYNILRKNIYQLAVLNEISKVIDQIRENDGIIHISEFDKRIAGVVNNEPVPFIYERLGERYHHFLIDEFQDTSVLEWQNILPLIENALAVDHFNLVVGDGKQAIYRFKGGEVEQLDRLPEIYARGQSPEMLEREASLGRNYNPSTLEFNFRSLDEIIKFNNAFYQFCAGMLPENLKKIYADCEQKIMKSKPGGEVQIRFVDMDDVKAVKEPAYFEHIMNIVQSLKETNAYAYQDMAVLCRSNKEASKIARNMLQNGIEVVSAESLLISSSPEVNFLMNCLIYVQNAQDKVSVAGILEYLTAGNDHVNFNELLRSVIVETGNGTTFKTLDAYLLDSGIKFQLQQLLQMGLYERVETLISIFSLDDKPDPYIIFFLDIVHEFTMNNRNNQDDFPAYWRENRHRFSIVVPDGMDAVKVMTIHKAKGLEFPVVIYPFANDRVEIKNEQAWVGINDRGVPALKTALLPVTKSLIGTQFESVYEHEWEMQQLDMLNILYVATTRPVEKLFIICDRPREAATEIKNIPGLIRAFLEDRNMWHEDQLVYVIGNPASLRQDKRKAAQAIHPEVFITGSWREHIRLSGHASEYWDLEDDAKNLEWGNLVHRILSKVNTVTDLPSAILGEVSKGNITEAKGKDLRDWLYKILTSKSISCFFDGSYRLKNEAAILQHADGHEYRPDRLMINDKNVIILDYKTGKEEDKHIRQIEKYAELLSGMGFQNVERYLLYLGEEYYLKQV